MNILLITDPGVGKCTILQQLKKLPNVQYATMTGASGALFDITSINPLNIILDLIKP
ncbi:hypothetical protein ACO3TA_01240 [Methanocaldococcus sp. 28A]